MSIIAEDQVTITLIEDGAQGPQGIQGEKGDTGAQGPQGIQGEKGDTGATGAQGPQGEKGDTGAQGPQGDKGETGAQGPQGTKGDTGAQGPKGDDGQDGKSAYEAAVEAGYAGTEEDFNADLARTARIEQIESDLTSIEGRVDTAESDISTVESNISGLSTRVTTAESGISGLSTRITAAESDISSAESDISGIKTRVTTAESNISGLSTRVATAESDISSVESDISGLSTRVTTAESDISDVEASVSGLSTRITTAEETLDLVDDLANEAKEDAASAEQSAGIATAQLGIVQNIVGVLEMIRTHGEYDLSTDTEVINSKYYFTRSGTSPDYEYSLVDNPSGNPSTEGWYELVGVDEAIQNYVSSHLILTNDGLELKKDDSKYRMKLNGEALEIVAPDGTIVGSHGETITLGDVREIHFEATATRIKFATPNSDLCWFGLNPDGIWEMHVETTYVEKMVRYGDYAFIKRENGNMSLKWLG